MQEVTSTIVIKRPVQAVFAFTLNPENTPKWVDGVVQEQASEVPAKLGTVYRNQGRDGAWGEFIITAFQAGASFVMSKQGDDIDVCYTFRAVDNNWCELEYTVRSNSGTLGERFGEAAIEKILSKLKVVMEQ